jgi:hypothetical protein
MDECWCAFCLSIIEELLPEQAFVALETGDISDLRKRNILLTDKDTEDMIAMKKEITFREIGEIYGISTHAVIIRTRRYLQKHKK